MDKTNPDISIVVPLYNEGKNIPPLISALENVLDGLDRLYEIVLVDDGSTDDTLSGAKKAASRNPRVKIVTFKKNFGQTAAMAAGFDHSTGNIIIPMDGDLQNDPRDIPRLLEKLDEGYDVVSGWRKNRKDQKLKRIVPSVIANKVISIISGVHLHDYGCSLKAYRREVIEDVRLYGEMHRFIPIYAVWHGASVTEIEVTHHPRKFGKSKYGIERTFKVILDLVVIKFLGQYVQKPIYIFGGLGIISLLGGFFAGFLAFYFKLIGGKSFVETPLPQLCVLLFILGFNSILMGLLAEICIRIYYESQGKRTYLVKETINFDRQNQ